MIVTIDGPAGTGKSTVAKQLARELGFEYLDTGAMYRMIGLHALNLAADVNDLEEVAKLARSVSLDFVLGTAMLNGYDVTAELRSQAATLAASVVAQNPEVRRILVERQREIAASQDIVCEGRDQGTVAFPHAECKFFMTADSRVRAQRRYEDLTNAGKTVDFEQLVQEQNERDLRDQQREASPMKPAPDAIEIDTTTLNIDEVVTKLAEIVRQRMTLEG